MVDRMEKSAASSKNGSRKGGIPRCREIATRGIKTAQEFSSFMSQLMSDLVLGNVTPQVGNAAVNAGGKILKVVEMQYKYGKVKGDGTDSRELRLVE